MCQGTYKRTANLKATAVPMTSELLNEINNCSQDSENFTVPQKADPDCMFVKSSEDQALINDDISHSHTVEGVPTPLPCPQDTETTSFPGEVRRDCREQYTVPSAELLSENSSKQKERNKNQCMFCLKTFDFPSKLSRHLLSHTGIRPFECQICYKSFKQLSHLQCHQWVHSRKDRTMIVGNLKSYQCAVCFKSFEAPSKLKRHYVIHTGQRPFQCSVCDRAFTQSGHLKTHMLSHR
uniref:C2H2-type domain-containing protein n=1 Tax=Electrophorus electricus TaxID=8005 RepID=A0AAY5EMN4_ELEEL